MRRSNQDKFDIYPRESFVFLLLITYVGSIDTCERRSDFMPNTIILPDQSLDAGAKFLEKFSVNSMNECHFACCHMLSCTSAVLKSKTTQECFLFNCGTPNKCIFGHRANYDVITMKLSTKQSRQAHLGEACDRDHMCDTSYSVCSDGHCVCQSGWLRRGTICVLSVCKSPELQFQCNDSSTCVAVYDRCNGIVECPDGSDELGCPAAITESSTSSPTVPIHLRLNGRGKIPENQTQNIRATDASVPVSDQSKVTVKDPNPLTPYDANPDVRLAVRHSSMPWTDAKNNLFTRMYREKPFQPTKPPRLTSHSIDELWKDSPVSRHFRPPPHLRENSWYTMEDGWRFPDRKNLERDWNPEVINLVRSSPSDAYVYRNAPSLEEEHTFWGRPYRGDSLSHHMALRPYPRGDIYRELDRVDGTDNGGADGNDMDRSHYSDLRTNSRRVLIDPSVFRPAAMQDGELTRDRDQYPLMRPAHSSNQLDLDIDSVSHRLPSTDKRVEPERQQANQSPHSTSPNSPSAEVLTVLQQNQAQGHTAALVLAFSLGLICCFVGLLIFEWRRRCGHRRTRSTHRRTAQLLLNDPDKTTVLRGPFNSRSRRVLRNLGTEEENKTLYDGLVL